jgi:hypothetical protein
MAGVLFFSSRPAVVARGLRSASRPLLPRLDAGAVYVTTVFSLLLVLATLVVALLAGVGDLWLRFMKGALLR